MCYSLNLVSIATVNFSLNFFLDCLDLVVSINYGSGYGDFHQTEITITPVINTVHLAGFNSNR